MATAAETRPRTARASTRERLMSAAAALIGDWGWGAVTSRAIADRAGVNNGLVHYHFGSVEALRREAALSVLESEFDAPLVAFADAADTASGVDAFAQALADSARGGSMAVLVEALAQAGRDPRVRSATLPPLREFRTQIAEKLAADRGRGPGATGEEAAVAEVVAASLDGLALHAVVDPDFDVAAAGRALAAMVQGHSG